MIKTSLIFFLVFQFFCHAQNKSTVTELIEGKWELVGVESEKKTDYFTKIRKEFYEFKSNGIFYHETDYLDSTVVNIIGTYKIKKKGKKLKLKNKMLKIYPPSRSIHWNRKATRLINSVSEQDLIFITRDKKAIYFKRVN